MRFLFLLFLLAGCATSNNSSYNQTASPTVYRPPPVNTPGYYPGTPREPVYTPNGAGLPGERVPGSIQSSVPRSPNKRILPPTKEPGLWAGDGTVKASDQLPDVPMIAGIELPFPPGAATDKDKLHTRLCALGMSLLIPDVARELQWDAMALPLDVRRCIAARLYEHCTSSFRAKLEGIISANSSDISGLEHLLIQRAVISSTDRTAKRFVEKVCPGVPRSTEVEEALTLIMMTWDSPGEFK